MGQQAVLFDAQEVQIGAVAVGIIAKISDVNVVFVLRNLFPIGIDRPAQLEGLIVGDGGGVQGVEVDVGIIIMCPDELFPEDEARGFRQGCGQAPAPCGIYRGGKVGATAVVNSCRRIVVVRQGVRAALYLCPGEGQGQDG